MIKRLKQLWMKWVWRRRFHNPWKFYPFVTDPAGGLMAVHYILFYVNTETGEWQGYRATMNTTEWETITDPEMLWELNECRKQYDMLTGDS